MIIKTLLFFILINCFAFAQEVSSITLSRDNKSYQIPAYNLEGNIYVSIKALADGLKLAYEEDKFSKKIELEINQFRLVFVAKNPFVILRSTETDGDRAIQLYTSTHLISDYLFVPLVQLIDLLNEFYSESIVIVSPNKIMVIDEIEKDQSIIKNIALDENEKGTFINIEYSGKLKPILRGRVGNSFTLGFGNTKILSPNQDDISKYEYIEDIKIIGVGNDLELTLEMTSGSIAFEFIQDYEDKELTIHLFRRVDAYWLERESKHFKLVYREQHAHLANHILMSAENALLPLMDLFDYSPREKIIINTYDVSDYGFGGTITVPQNFIRLEIEPLEPGYEVIPHNDRYQWLISHELVHIVVNDQSTGVEPFLRKIFGKVPPEKTQPLTIIYSLITNFNRYTPRWHQEAIAIFIETWFSGGYGRLLGNFDEMYFRTLVLEEKEFPSQLEIETLESHNSMFLETIFYLYGARFISYLAISYSSTQVIDWFKTEKGNPFIGFEGNFERVFGKSFENAWNEFIEFEKNFEKKSIKILNSSETTKVRKIGNKKFGWISQPFLDERTSSLLFSYHRPHQLATINKLSLPNGVSTILNTLPTPSMFQVASTAFDESYGLYFYTTNNNQLYRDIWVYDIETDDQKQLFENARVGDLTISSLTHDLWGIQHQSGLSTLMLSPYPYKDLESLITLAVGDELFHLSTNNNGDKLAAVLKQSNGQQSIIVIDVETLKNQRQLDYITLSNSGTPENPSWSRDGRFLYWNAYTNGVSNIYRFDFIDFSLAAISHCLTGLFKPVEITPDSILAFEFSTDGFFPVIFENKPADHLPAINYLGQKILEKEPELFDWALPNPHTAINPKKFTNEKEYNGFLNLNIQSLVPVITGFQNQIVLGIYSRISDPLLLHDFLIEAGISPFKEVPDFPLWHFRFMYDYKQLFEIDISHNGPDFFDLFNNRTRGMLGTKIKLGHTHYWKYDKPHKIKQTSSLTFYSGVDFINDNLVSVSQPDFGVLATNVNSKNLRKSIGSSDYEHGNDIYLTFTLYGTEFDSPQLALNTYLEFSDFSTWLTNHNVLHVKFAAGYLFENENLVQSQFYFGGFGNRGVDNGEIRQFRNVFRFPGIPIYSLMTNKFLKLMLENDFPPLRIGNISLGHQFVNHLDFAIYTQGLFTKSDMGDYWIDLGAQLDLKLKHWYNLESTISFGVAKAWSDKVNDWEWFLSLKLLKD